MNLWEYYNKFWGGKACRKITLKNRQTLNRSLGLACTYRKHCDLPLCRYHATHKQVVFYGHYFLLRLPWHMAKKLKQKKNTILYVSLQKRRACLRQNAGRHALTICLNTWRIAAKGTPVPCFRQENNENSSSHSSAPFGSHPHMPQATTVCLYSI